MGEKNSVEQQIGSNKISLMKSMLFIYFVAFLVYAGFLALLFLPVSILTSSWSPVPTWLGVAAVMPPLFVRKDKQTIADFTDKKWR